MNKSWRRATAGAVAKIAFAILVAVSTQSQAAQLTVSNCADSGASTLRDVITQANMTDEADVVVFDLIPAGGVFPVSGQCPAFSGVSGVPMISLQSPLPVVTKPLRINGTSQPGVAGTGPRVRLDGQGQIADGVVFQATGCTTATCWVQGMMITGMTGAAIYVQGTNGLVADGDDPVSPGIGIMNNYLGTNGVGALGGGDVGVRVVNTLPILRRIGRVDIRRNQIVDMDKGALLGNAESIMASGNHFGLLSGGAVLPNRIGVVVGAAADVCIGAGFACGNGNMDTFNAFAGAAEGADESTAIYVENVSAERMVRIEGNRIGMDQAGTTLRGSLDYGMQIHGAVDAAIAQNFIAGHVGAGIYVAPDVSGTVTMSGNCIGTDGTCSALLAPVGSSYRGIIAGAGEYELSLTSNIVGGQTYGVDINSDNATIEDNRIGVSLNTPLAALPNLIGVRVCSNSVDVSDNIVSGNQTGLLLCDSASDVGISENIIGIGASPGNSPAFGNVGVGVEVGMSDVGPLSGITISDNLIAGNGDDGLRLAASGATMQVASNTIQGNAGSGIVVRADNVLIEGNLFSGQGTWGLEVDGSVAHVTTVHNNLIAFNASGGIRLHDFDNRVANVGADGEGNSIYGHPTGPGIRISAGSNASKLVVESNTLGVSGAGNAVGLEIVASNGAQILANTIGHNLGAGVAVRSGESNAILDSTFVDNGGLAIDLGPEGPAVNDPLDADAGANGLQNAPMLDPLFAGQLTGVGGLLHSAPNTTYRVDLYRMDACPESGLADGERVGQSEIVSTDDQGDAEWGVFIAGLVNGDVYGAMATRLDPNDTPASSSELSPCRIVGGPEPGAFGFASADLLVPESAGALEIQVVRSGGSDGAAQVTVSTLDGSALAGQDYSALTQVLEFGDGESIKTVDVPILANSPAVGDREFEVRLSAPTNGATLGSIDATTVQIVDGDPAAPVLSVADASVLEPVAGHVDLIFTVSVGPTSSPLVVNYATGSGTAEEGSDFTGTEGALEFEPSATPQSRTISVEVLADGLTDETDETFVLELQPDGPVGEFSTLLATGRIHPSTVVFRDGFESSP